MNLRYIIHARFPTERAHGTQITKMCEAFALTGANVSLVTPNKKNPTKGDDVFGYYNVRQNFSIVRLPSTDLLGKTLHFGRLFYVMDIAAFLFSLFFTQAIAAGDVLYTRDPLLLLPFSRKKYTLCVEVHDIPKHTAMFIALLKRAHKVIALNDIVRSELVALGIAPEKTMAAVDGVDIAEFDINATQESARQQLSLPKDVHIALYTGHLYAWKGADTLAEATRYLSNAVCVFVGGVDAELEQFKKKYAGVSNIILVPFQNRNRIPLYLKSADVLVIPNSAKSAISAKYTSPLKLFEYMVSKRPIVVSDLPSMRQVLNETNALFAEPDNSQSFANAIKKILDDNDLGLSLSGEAYTEVKKYSWAKRALHILEKINQQE